MARLWTWRTNRAGDICRDADDACDDRGRVWDGETVTCGGPKTSDLIRRHRMTTVRTVRGRPR